MTSKRSATNNSSSAAAVIVLDSSDDDDDNRTATTTKENQSGPKSTTSNRRATVGTIRALPNAAAAAQSTTPVHNNNSSVGGGANLSQNKVNNVKNLKRASISSSSSSSLPAVAGYSTFSVQRSNKPSSSATATSTPPPQQTATPPLPQSQPRRIKPTLISSTISPKRVQLIGDSDDDDLHKPSFVANRTAPAPNDDDDITIISPTTTAAATVASAADCTSPMPNKKLRLPSGEASATDNGNALITPVKRKSDSKVKTKSAGKEATTPPTSVKAPITAAFASLLSACREAEPSDAMERLITRKLLRYYHSVHPEFVCSKSFSRAALRVAADIRQQPKLVYMKLENILEELRVRHRSGEAASAKKIKTEPKPGGGDAATPIKSEATPSTTPTADSAAAATSYTNDSATTSPTTSGQPPIASTGNAKKDQQIRRLNHALHVLKKRIAHLEESEVDLDDEDNSVYLLGERYKKRACEIYAKICDITGESRNACRATRQPIVFQGTAYPLFNRTIQSFVNRTHVFPDLHDVRRCLEHCNQQYEFGMGKEEVRRVAQDAFVKIGKLLQRRRKLDLYETVTYLTTTAAAAKTAAAPDDGAGVACAASAGGQSAEATAPVAVVDPALNDEQLQRKLAENEAESRRRMHEIIDRFAAAQDQPESKKNANKGKSEDKTSTESMSPKTQPSPETVKATTDDDDEKTSKQTPDDAAAIVQTETQQQTAVAESTATAAANDNDNDTEKDNAPSTSCIILDDD